jgi:hypothetical protein
MVPACSPPSRPALVRQTEQEHPARPSQRGREGFRKLEVALDELDSARQAYMGGIAHEGAHALATRRQCGDQLSADIAGGARDQEHRQSNLSTSAAIEAMSSGVSGSPSTRRTT